MRKRYYQGFNWLAVPATINLYAYCGGDPINASDPEGLEPEEFSAYQKNVLKRGVNIVTRFGHKGQQIDQWRFTVGSGPVHLISKYGKTGGYQMETNSATGNVNVNKAWFDENTKYANLEDVYLPTVVGAIANETYHVRHPEDGSGQAEHRSDLYEIEVLQKWKNSLAGKKKYEVMSGAIDAVIQEVKEHGTVSKFDQARTQREKADRPWPLPGPWGFP